MHSPKEQSETFLYMRNRHRLRGQKCHSRMIAGTSGSDIRRESTSKLDTRSRNIERSWEKYWCKFAKFIKDYLLWFYRIEILNKIVTAYIFLHLKKSYLTLCRNWDNYYIVYNFLNSSFATNRLFCKLLKRLNHSCKKICFFYEYCRRIFNY